MKGIQLMKNLQDKVSSLMKDIQKMEFRFLIKAIQFDEKYSGEDDIQTDEGYSKDRIQVDEEYPGGGFQTDEGYPVAEEYPGEGFQVDEGDPKEGIQG